jgi:hypothetical protein
MSPRRALMARVLLANGIVDLGCAAILLVLPLLHVPLLGYQVFDAQGAFMAGGWGITTLALAVGRLWAAPRPAYHPVMLLLGLFESTALAVYSVLHLVLAHLPIMQVLLPLTVGVVFGLLYLVSLCISAGAR